MTGCIRGWLAGTTSTSSLISAPFPEEYGDDLEVFPASYQRLANATE
jgi:hypothetical protein